MIIHVHLNVLHLNGTILHVHCTCTVHQVFFNFKTHLSSYNYTNRNFENPSFKEFTGFFSQQWWSGKEFKLSCEWWATLNKPILWYYFHVIRHKRRNTECSLQSCPWPELIKIHVHLKLHAATHTVHLHVQYMYM